MKAIDDSVNAGGNPPGHRTITGALIRLDVASVGQCLEGSRRGHPCPARLNPKTDSRACHNARMESVYEAVGGIDGLRRLAGAWHKRVIADEVVGHAFSHGFHPDHTERLAAYWAEALGGAATYSALYGNESSVVKMHSGNGPHEEMDRRAIICFDEALTDVGLTDDPLRQVLHDYFAWATNTTMSRYHNSADDVPDGLSVPRWSWDGLQTGGDVPD